MLKRTVVVASILVALAALSINGYTQEPEEFRGAPPSRKATTIIVTNGPVACQQPVTVKARKYYQTTSPFDGGHALTACSTGYHMANLMEILNPSTMQYDTTLGATADDSGQGPPTLPGDVFAWIRNGLPSSANNTSGNCKAWSTGGSIYYGTAAALKNPDFWSSASGIDPWLFETSTCDSSFHVWCVQDYN